MWWLYMRPARHTFSPSLDLASHFCKNKIHHCFSFKKTFTDHRPHRNYWQLYTYLTHLMFYFIILLKWLHHEQMNSWCVQWYVPELFYPSLKSHVSASVFQNGCAALLSAQSLGQVQGVFCGHTAGRREVRGTLWMTQSVTFWDKREKTVKQTAVGRSLYLETCDSYRCR